MALNDDKWASLKTLTSKNSSIEDLEYIWLRGLVAPFIGSIQDMWNVYLISQGHINGALQGRMNNYFAALGFTGPTFQERMAQFWKSGGAVLPTPALTWLTASSDATPDFAFDAGVGVMVAGDAWRLEIDTNSSFTAPQVVTGTVSAPDALDGDINATLVSALPRGTNYARMKVTGKTNWSNTASQAIDFQMTSAAVKSVNENNSADIFIQTLTANQSATFAIGGVDAAKFKIVSGNQLWSNGGLDYEAPADTGANNVYDITITPTSTVDAAVGAAQAVVVTILDISDTVVNFSTLYARSEKQGHYDPQTIANLFQTTDTSTPVTTSGQSIGRVNDASGRGNHLTQPTSGIRPLYDVASGRKSIYTSFNSSWLVTPSNVDISSGPIVNVVMALADGDPGTGTYFEISDGTNSQVSPGIEMLRVYSSPNPQIQNDIFGNSGGKTRILVTNTASTGNGERFYIRGRFDFSSPAATQVQVWINGASVGTLSFSNNDTDANYGTTRRISLLGRNAGEFPALVTRCFMAYWINGDLTASEITYLEAQAAASIA